MSFCPFITTIHTQYQFTIIINRRRSYVGVDDEYCYLYLLEDSIVNYPVFLSLFKMYVLEYRIQLLLFLWILRLRILPFHIKKKKEILSFVHFPYTGSLRHRFIKELWFAAHFLHIASPASLCINLRIHLLHKKLAHFNPHLMRNYPLLL